MKLDIWIGGNAYLMHIIFFSLSICLSALEPRSHFKVKCLCLCFVYAPYLPHSYKGFSWNLAQMCSSLRRCAEGMSQPFGLKVKVTLKDQVFESAFCVISPTFFWGFLWNLAQICSSGDVQKGWVNHFDLRSRSHFKFKSLILHYRPLHIYHIFWRIFMKLASNV